jgi:ribonuclease HI
LTWEALRRRGWEGPGICILCKLASEDVNHLLVHCVFSREVWNLLIQSFSLSVDWKGPTLSACFSSWTSQKSSSPSLAAHTCWQIWAERNKAVFEDHSPSVMAVVHRVRASFFWQHSSLGSFPPLVCEIPLTADSTLACFDGAARATGLCCGAGGFFKALPNKVTKWFLNCGEGSNTKAELLGLWTTLALASLWSMDHLRVFGDSRVVIDWINQKCKLQSVQIEAWKEKTLYLSKLFRDINYRHFSRIHNKEADALSKRALGEKSGRLSCSTVKMGLKVP